MSNDLIGASASSSIAAPLPLRAPEKASAATWFAVLAGMIGAFMAILNIQITNASLLNIEGGIGTGVDNGAWVSTSYLIGEIVVIPMTFYLSRVFSFRRFILFNTMAFALFSIGLRLCSRPGDNDRVTRSAGLCRRCADPDGRDPGDHQIA